MQFAPAILGLATLFASVSVAADSTAAPIDSSRFRIDANVVLINATVLDRHDRPVLGIAREQFRVYEDKAEQSIAYFAEEEVPLSLAVIFDVSGSMDGKMAGMRAALDAVLRSANVQDEFSLITFADKPLVAIDWTSNPQEIKERLLNSSAHGQTSLLDALEKGLACMKTARNARQAMIVFSDGGDNHSRSTEREVLRSLVEAGVQIYAVQSSESYPLRSRSAEEIFGTSLLDRLCDQAGGRYFQVDGRRDLQAAAEQIARELRSEYLIGYVPSAGARDGRFHAVRVQVKRNEGTPKLTVFWRKGYRASVN
jgi:Ca-activated chloride channel family protein